MAAVFFLPLLGIAPLFDWDEINFAECAREMMVTGDYLRVNIGFRPFYEKPPLFFWLQAGAMHLFGVNEYAARLPNALAGIVTVWLFYSIGRRYFSERLGRFWALAYLGSLLPHFYFRTGIIDPVFNLFIFLGLFQLILFYWKRSAMLPGQLYSGKDRRHLLLGGVFTGLAILTKGPVGLLLILLTLFGYWLWQRLRFFITPLQFLIYLGATLVTAGLWFGAETLANGPEFTLKFITYQIRLFSIEDAGHGGFPGYHFVVLLLGCFPASIFALRPALNGWRRRGSTPEENFRQWMFVLLWVVLVLFTVVSTKIVHYSSMAYFPLTFLAAYSLERLADGRYQWRRWQRGFWWGVGGLWALVLLALPLVPLTGNLGAIQELINDPFARANLNAEVHWPVYTLLPGVALLTGWLFGGLWLSRGQWQRGVLAAFLGVGLCINLATYWFLPRVLAYSQGAAVEFYQQHQGRPVYVHTLNYKSYVPWFYSRFQPPDNPAYYQAETVKGWLREGKFAPGKEVYWIAKLPKIEQYKTDDRLHYLGQRNGYAFFRQAKPTD